MPDGRLRRAQRITHLRHKCDEAARRDRTNRRPRVIATSQQRGQRHQRDGGIVRENQHGHACGDECGMWITGTGEQQQTDHERQQHAEHHPNVCGGILVETLRGERGLRHAHEIRANHHHHTLPDSGAYWHFDGGWGIRRLAHSYHYWARSRKTPLFFRAFRAPQRADRNGLSSNTVHALGSVLSKVSQPIREEGRS